MYYQYFRLSSGEEVRGGGGARGPKSSTGAGTGVCVGVGLPYDVFQGTALQRHGSFPPQEFVAMRKRYCYFPRRRVIHCNKMGIVMLWSGDH